MHNEQTHIVLAGHSHLSALARTLRSPDVPTLIDHISDDRYKVVESNEWPRSMTYWKAASHLQQNSNAVILYDGNQHFALFMFAPQPPIDIFVDGLPIQNNCTLIPKSMIRERFSASIRGLREAVGFFDSQRLAIQMTPPPRRDAGDFRKSILNETFYINMAKSLNIDIRDVKLSSDLFLLKLYFVLKEMYLEVANDMNCHFIPVPQETIDQDGFLLPKYSADLTHANSEYGEIVLDNIRKYFDN
jgi:hypothetical protein